MGVTRWSIVDQGEVRIDNQGVSTTYLRLIVGMSSPDDNETALKVGLPQFQRFQPHINATTQARFTGDPGGTPGGTELNLYVSEFQATQKKGTVIWDVMVTYTDALVANPLLIAVEIGEVQTYTIPGATLVDYEGNAILNTAGEPPEPFDKPERVMQIPFIKNVAADLPTWLFDWEDCVNSNTVLVGSGAGAFPAAPKTLLISSIKLSSIQEMGGIKYRACTVETLYRKTTWEQIFPSRGFNQKVTERVSTTNPTTGAVTTTTRTNLTPILIKGEVPTEAQFLDINGAWIPHPNPEDVYLLKALLQTPVDFSTFPLS